MAILIDRDDPRGAAAITLALRSETWTSIGAAWRIPSRSRDGVSYVTTSVSCSCPDHRFNARCAHSLAAALVNALRDESAAF